MTAAQIICEVAGLSISEVCRSAHISEARFKQFARNGKAPNVAAERLCHVLGDAVDPMIFIFGYERWKQLLGNGKSGDAFPSVGRRQSDAHRRQRPDSILQVVE
jgi:hypothetical protein